MHKHKSRDKHRGEHSLRLLRTEETEDSDSESDSSTTTSTTTAATSTTTTSTAASSVVEEPKRAERRAKARGEQARSGREAQELMHARAEVSDLKMKLALAERERKNLERKLLAASSEIQDAKVRTCNECVCVCAQMCQCMCLFKLFLN